MSPPSLRGPWTSLLSLPIFLPLLLEGFPFGQVFEKVRRHPGHGLLPALPNGGEGADLEVAEWIYHSCPFRPSMGSSAEDSADRAGKANGLPEFLSTPASAHDLLVERRERLDQRVEL